MHTIATTIHFKANVVVIGTSHIVRIPEDESIKLSSRGQIAVNGTINSHHFTTVLEPDGYWSHYIKVDEKLPKELITDSNDKFSFELTQTKLWPEPTIPEDFAAALADAPEKVQKKWSDITAMARWEWIRWVNSTANSGTRAIRIEKSVSKLNGTHRRPCCFNLAACTDPDVSKSGRLSIPT